VRSWDRSIRTIVGFGFRTIVGSCIREIVSPEARNFRKVRKVGGPTQRSAVILSCGFFQILSTP
jgi:hypothetical protein